MNSDRIGRPGLLANPVLQLSINGDGNPRTRGRPLRQPNYNLVLKFTRIASCAITLNQHIVNLEGQTRKTSCIFACQSKLKPTNRSEEALLASTLAQHKHDASNCRMPTDRASHVSAVIPQLIVQSGSMSCDDARRQQSVPRTSPTKTGPIP